MNTGRLVVAMTGASGAIYALRFLKHAAGSFKELHLIVTDEALQVIGQETGRGITRQTLSAETLIGESAPSIVIHNANSYFTPPASGSFRHDGMVVIPCTVGMAGRIAAGTADDLVSRAADVTLKEGRKLIVVVRETPLNLIHLRNLTRLAEAGACILPACPGFYNHPTTVEQLVDTVVARVLQNLGVDQSIVPQWQVKD